MIIILDTGQTKFHLCVCNVGDSLAYVYSDGQVITVILVLTLLKTFQNYSRLSWEYSVVCLVFSHNMFRPSGPDHVLATTKL